VTVYFANKTTTIMRIIVLAITLLLSLAICAEDKTNAMERPFSKDGADTCLQCHDQDSKFPVLAIFNTAHGNKNSHQGPFANNGLQCEACHGAAGEHSVKRLRKGEQRAPMITFKAKDELPIAEKNSLCLTCHNRSSAKHWQGSSHQVNNISCTDCHNIHVQKDAILTKANQLEQCGKCHINAKLSAHQASSHPLTTGQMGCTDCHKPHDANTDKLLAADSVNETCYQCHSEKRGPFLWQHDPVADSCINCHRPHGSNQPALLSQRAPFLCQTCHSAQGHPSINHAAGLAQQKASVFLLGKSCTNCHSKVHGSNHPSGSRLQR
jgi:DmsE family decaheme c-type cytochrome